MRVIAPPIPVFPYRGFGSAEAAKISGSVASTLALIAPATGPAAPFVAAAAAAAALVALAESVFSGCGTTCYEATDIVNEVEPYLQQNNQNYFSNPNRTTLDQAIALATASRIFSVLQQNCGNPALGTAGQNCISERIGNGMAKGSNTCAYGESNPAEYPPYSDIPYPAGQCWTWTLAYYDSIAADNPPGLPLPIVQVLANLGLSLTQTFYGIPVIYLAGVGILLAALFMLHII